MTRITRTSITIQTERLLVMGNNRSLYSLCAECGDEVCMVTVDQASSLTGARSRDIYRDIEDGKIHFIETAKGSLLICFNSLNRGI
jgi:hypothetical protein